MDIGAILTTEIAVGILTGLITTVVIEGLKFVLEATRKAQGPVSAGMILFSGTSSVLAGVIVPLVLLSRWQAHSSVFAKLFENVPTVTDLTGAARTLVGAGITTIAGNSRISHLSGLAEVAKGAGTKMIPGLSHQLPETPALASTSPSMGIRFSLISSLTFIVVVVAYFQVRKVIAAKSH